jgi:hypothetical protein
MKKIHYNFIGIGLLIGMLALVLVLTSAPAAAQVDLCTTGEGETNDAAQSIRTIFIILSALGPLFGTLFYVGLSVADAASIENDYSDQKRKVIISGFSVPIAIAFFSVVGDELIRNTTIDCFFPGYEEE